MMKKLHDPTPTLLVMVIAIGVMAKAGLPPSTTTISPPFVTSTTPPAQDANVTMATENITFVETWVINVETSDDNSGNIIVSWDEPWLTDWNASYIHYNVTVDCYPLYPSCQCPTCQSNSVSITALSHTFMGHPATNYSIEVVMEDENGLTLARQTIFVTEDEAPITSIVTVIASPTSLAFSWSYACPYTGPVKYLFSLQNQQLDIQDTGECHYQATTEGLEPYTNYTYSLLTVHPDCNISESCPPKPQQFRNKEGNTKEDVESAEERGQEGTTGVNVGITEANEGTAKPEGQEGTTGMNVEITESDNEGSTVEENGYYNENENTSRQLPACKEMLCEANQQDEKEKQQEKEEKGASQCSVCYYNIVQTLPDVPSAPQNLQAVPPQYQVPDSTGRRCPVYWAPPARQNGELHHYLLTYWREEHRHAREQIVEVSSQGNSSVCPMDIESGLDWVCHLLEDIEPESSYTLSVVAVNKDPANQRSAPVFHTFHTGAGVPYYNNDQTPLTLSPQDENAQAHPTTQALSINTTTFSHRNGKIRRYELWLKKMVSEGKDCLVFCTSDLLTRSIVIGQTTSPDDPACPTLVQNKPLEPVTVYACSVRIYTEVGDVQSAWIFFKTDAVPLSLVMILTVVLAVMLVLVAGILALYYVYTVHFRYNMKRSNSLNLCIVMVPPPDVSVERRIILSQLLSAVSNLHAYGMIGLKREYAELKSASPVKSCTVASLPFNQPKNRYTNILPYDDARVILKEYRRAPYSDYINASYIHGHSKPREFIACQGPKDSNLEDFWRMVWEKNVYVLVMVTQCIEKNTRKCSKYWPDVSNKTGLKLGRSGLTITTLDEAVQDTEDYIIRHIHITKGYRSRTVQHFHFVGWPDMGCTQTPDTLIAFVRAVKAAVPPESCHVIVHCSAGVGRTGTLIALSNLMEEMEEQDSVDIFNAVYKMRLHRMNMVQTEAQYSFLYKCVLKYHLDQTGQTHTWTDVDGCPSIPDILSGVSDVTTTLSPPPVTHGPLYPLVMKNNDSDQDELLSDDEVNDSDQDKLLTEDKVEDITKINQ